MAGVETLTHIIQLILNTFEPDMVIDTQTKCSYLPKNNIKIMMTSSNGKIFHVTGPLCGEFTGDRWIPRAKASDTEF